MISSFIYDGYFNSDQCDSSVIAQPNMDELLKLPYINYSTKMKWLIGFLKKKLKENPDEKIVVVSQVKKEKKIHL